MSAGKLALVPPASALTGIENARNAAAKRCVAWNKANRVVTPVAVRLVAKGPEYATTTKSVAWLKNTTALVLIEGRSGGWELALVRPLKAGEKLRPLPPSGAPPASYGDEPRGAA